MSDMIEIDENYRETLLEEAQAYCDLAKIKLPTLGAKVAKDNRFFENLSKGSSCTVDTYLKIINWIREQSALLIPKQDTASNPASPASQH